MKKFILHLFVGIVVSIVLLPSARSQDKLKPNFSQKVKMEHLKEGFITSGYTFTYQDDIYMLVNNLNVKVLYLMYFMKLTPFTNNISLYRINKGGKNKKGIAENVDIPLKGKMYDFETAWFKDGVLNIYTSYKNGLSKKKNYFCTRYNLATKKSESAMIFRVDKKEKPKLKLSKNEQFMMAITEKKKDKKSFYVNYGVINHENEWVEQGENILCQLQNDYSSSNYFVTNKGNVIFSVTTRLPKKSVLKKRNHTEEIFGLKQGQLTKIIAEDAAEFVSPKVFFVDRDGSLRICCLFGESANRFSGISISDVNENNFTIGANKNFLFKDIVDNSLPQGRIGSYQKITKIRTSADGSIFILSENFSERMVTTTTRRGTGSNARYESKTDYYYDYGPGMVYSFDKDFNHLASTRFNYKASYKNQDLGCGLDFICTPQNIYLFSDKYFYKYVRGNHAYNGKGYTRFKLKGALKSFVGQHNEYLFSEQTNFAYVFEVLSKREFKIHEYNLN